jgi:hypothetical protein
MAGSCGCGYQGSQWGLGCVIGWPKADEASGCAERRMSVVRHRKRWVALTQVSDVVESAVVEESFLANHWTTRIDQSRS